MRSILGVNDIVLWRGTWGSDAPQRAKVTRIEVCEPGAKDGDEAAHVDWSLANAPRCEEHIVVNLDNGHWAYGSQLAPLEAE